MSDDDGSDIFAGFVAGCFIGGLAATFWIWLIVTIL